MYFFIFFGALVVKLTPSVTMNYASNVQKERKIRAMNL